MGDFPNRFGRYLLVERLAIGGMAELFLATSPGEHGFQKKVVIKRLLPHLVEDATYNAMFIDEAKLTARLVHPKIAQTFELGKVEGLLYIAMEYVDGIDVLALLREFASKRRRIEQPLAAWIAHEVLDALDYAHNFPGEDGTPLGIVHRDISPSNVLLSGRGDIKLVDFGIARAVDPERAHKSKSGTLKGKYGYMSPEQVIEQGLDSRSDLFSVGVVLAELLTGRRLFAAANELDVLLMVRDAKLHRLEKYGADIEPGLAAIVRKALRKPVDERWQTAAVFRDAIGEWLYEHRHRVTNRMVADVVHELHDSVIERRQRQMSGAPAGAAGAPAAAPAAPRVPASGPVSVPASGPVSVPASGPVSVPASGPVAAPASGRVVRPEAVPPPLPSSLRPDADGVVMIIEDPGDSMPNISVSYDLAPVAPVVPPVVPPAAPVVPPLASATPAAIVTPVVPPLPPLPPAAADDRPARTMATSELGGALPVMPPLPSVPSPIPTTRAETVPGRSLRAASDDLERGRPDARQDAIAQPITRQAVTEPLRVARTSTQESWARSPSTSDAVRAERASGSGAFRVASEGVIEVPIADTISAAVEAVADAGAHSEDSVISTFDDVLGAPRSSSIRRPTEEEVARTQPPTPPALADIPEPPDDTGDLGTTSPLRVLFRLMTARATGLLVVAIGGVKKDIYVRDGMPEYVSSNIASELFGNYLVTKGVLSDGELAMALAMMPHYGGKLGDTLVGLGLMKPLEVFRHLTRQVRTKIIDVCSWNKGSFAWYAGRENPREAFPLDFNAFEILGAGAMAMPDEHIEAWIARHGTIRLRASRTRRVGPERFEVLGLVQLCDLLDGSRSVSDLVELAPDHVERLRTGRMLCLLEACDLARPA